MRRALPLPSIAMVMSDVLPSLVPLKSMEIFLPPCSTSPTKTADVAASAFDLAFSRTSAGLGAAESAGVVADVVVEPAVEEPVDPVVGVSDFEHAAAPRLIASAPASATARVVMVFMGGGPLAGRVVVRQRPGDRRPA